MRKLLLLVLLTGCQADTKDKGIKEVKASWERFGAPNGDGIYRTKTPEGWLVKHGPALIYIQDRYHQWDQY